MLAAVLGLVMTVALPAAVIKLRQYLRALDRWETATRNAMTAEERLQDDLNDWDARQY